MENIVIATIKSWNIRNAKKLQRYLKDEYKIYVITNKEELNLDTLKQISPRYIFFPHWSWKIPREVYENFECIVFHIGDLPYGRGGSPLQNLIIRKIYNTKISAIKVEEGLDTGDIYIKKDFYIGLGSAEEIFIQASKIIFFEMIPFILRNNPMPYKQEGETVVFKRRTPEESNMLSKKFETLDDLYDFIRMLDAEGYPKAYIKLFNFKIMFSEVHRKSNKLVGRFEVIWDE